MASTSPRWQIVRTDADQPHHSRLLAANGLRANHGENVNRVSKARRSVEIAAESFGLTVEGWTDDYSVLQVSHPDGTVTRVPVETIDERADQA